MRKIGLTENPAKQKNWLNAKIELNRNSVKQKYWLNRRNG